LNKKVSNLCPQSATENFGILTTQAQQNTGIKDQWTNPYLNACQVTISRSYFKCGSPRLHLASVSKKCHLHFNITDR